MSKRTERQLPRAPGFVWTGPAGWRRFVRGNQYYDLDQLTDQVIERLLRTDPAYWGQRFRQATPPAEEEAPKPKTRRRASTKEQEGE